MIRLLSLLIPLAVAWAQPETMSIPKPNCVWNFAITLANAVMVIN